MDIIFNIIGISGVALILFGYFLLQGGKIDTTNLSYHLLNLIGAILILISLYWKPNIPSIIIEICWINISIYGLIQWKKNKG